MRLSARWGAIQGLSVAFLMGCVGCASPATSLEVEFFQSPPRQNLSSSNGTRPRLGPTSTIKRIELFGASNEIVSFCFSLRCGETPLSGPKLIVEPLRSVEAMLDPTAVDLFRLHPVAIDSWPGWHVRSVPADERDGDRLDILVPLTAPIGGLTSTISAGETLFFWADVRLSKETPPGEYAGRIVVLSGAKEFAEVPIRLTVWPLRVLDDNDTPFVVEVDAKHMPAASAALLQRHRLAPVLPDLAPSIKISPKGDAVLDWEDYDRTAEPLLSGEAFSDRGPPALWPLPVGPAISTLSASPRAASADSRNFVRHYLQECAVHFQNQGRLSRLYAAWPSTLPLSLPESDVMRHLDELLQSLRPRPLVVSRGFPQDLKPYGWVHPPLSVNGEDVDAWLPAAQFFDPAAMLAERRKGKRTWLSVDRPPFSGCASIHASPADTRVLSWQARQLGAEAVFLGAANSTPAAPNQLSPEDCVRHDPCTLLYPGQPFGLDEPVASVRLKLLRQTQQDAALARLLADRGLDHVRTALGRALAAYAGSSAYRTHFADGREKGWADDCTLYDTSRHIIAEELLHSAPLPRTSAQPESFERSALWRSFMQTTGGLHITTEGARIRMEGPSTAREAVVDCALTVYNRDRTPWEGSARILQPEGWSDADAPPTLTLPPHSHRRVRLSAKATAFPTESGGYFTLSAALDTRGGPVRKVPLRVTFLVATRPRTPPKIDGDLSDWPVGTGNVAGDFVLITGTGRQEEGRSGPRPRSETLAFVLADDNNLFIAVNSRGGAAPVASTPRRSAVDYDDMIPLGEELIELLFDPFNAGTRSPSDLLHVAVKRSGPMLAERGVGLDPPVGTRAAWPAEIESATADFGDRWCAEIRIPLAAFGAEAASTPIWGFNVTRFDAAHQEFSTWSGATGNAYDPLSLGNLHLPSSNR